MKRISADMHRAYYRLNEDHIVLLYNPKIYRFCVYIMDNNRNRLGQSWVNKSWCNYSSMQEIEELASKMLYDRGYNGEIVDYEIPGVKEWNNLPETGNLEYPITVRYSVQTLFGGTIPGREIINNSTEYKDALKRHKESRDILESINLTCYDKVLHHFYELNNYADAESSQLQYMSNAIRELLSRVNQGFSKDFINQLDEAYKMSIYLINKTNVLKSKIPKDLHLLCPRKYDM